MKIVNPKASIVFLIGLVVILQGCQKKPKSDELIKRYYSTGELEHEISMKDSLLHGLSTTYYKSGNIKYEKYFHDDIPIDHHYYYSENGSLLAYNFYDVRGNVRYQVFKDTLNEGYTEEGKSLYIQGEFNDHYAEGDSVALIPVVANPFKTKYKVMLLCGKQKIDKTYEFGSKKTPLFLYEIQQGNNPISIVSEVASNGSNSIFCRDTISIDLMGG